MNIAVDAMGGDYAPYAAVRGAVEAVSQLDIKVTLVGHKQVIADELALYSSVDRISVHHCTETIRMDEAPMKAVRQKKDASIRVAFDLVKRGVVDAVVSAGNSGSILAAGVLCLGIIDGVERPAIAGILPGEKGDVILIDVGANVDCRPAHLFQFGAMAEAFAASCLEMENPKIGLLSIGEEGGKGNELVQMARKLFEKSRLNFVGYVEGRDIFTGNVEIIVCDGFVGNVVLKLSEGMASAFTGLLEKEFRESFLRRLHFFLGGRIFDKFKKKLDYEEYGGAPLLGIKGVGIVCHGGSSPRAITNAVKLAARYLNNRVLEKIDSQLNTMN